MPEPCYTDDENGHQFWLEERTDGPTLVMSEGPATTYSWNAEYRVGAAGRRGISLCQLGPRFVDYVCEGGWGPRRVRIPTNA